MNMIFPKALQGKELDPGLGAYESLDPGLRAHLKNQIAVLHEAWLPEGRDGGSLLALPGGARLVRQKTALDWALFALGADYASPAGLIAALLPALVAQVPDIFIVRLDGPDASLHPAISAALELLGREDVHAMPLKGFPVLAAELSAAGAGRVVTLGCDIPGAANLPAKVKIGLDDSPADEKTLLWLHPGADIAAYKADGGYNAVITARAPAVCAPPAAPLVLDPAHAHIWFWPDLSPDFFRRESILLTANHG